MKRILMLTLFGGLFACVGAQDYATYLLEANFRWIKQNIISGWERNGGGDQAMGDLCLINGATLKKNLVKQTSGSIVLEYRFNANTKADGISWQLREKDVSAINILTSNGNLCYENSAGIAVALQPFIANTEIGVKVVADISAKKVDISVNGVLKASNVDFRNSVGGIDCFYLTTMNAGTLNLNLRNVYIHKGYIVNERFMAGDVNIPDDWSLNDSGGTVSVLRNEDAAMPPDCYSIKLNDASVSKSVSLTKTFASQSNKLEFEYKFMQPIKRDGFVAALGNGTLPAIKIVTDNGNLCYETSTGGKISVWDGYLSNVWYFVRVTADLSAHTADIYINDIKRATGVGFTNASVSSADKVSFTTSATGTDTVWLDDIFVYPFQPYPVDYVPSPIPVPHGSYRVGVQVCNLWREGNHFGWDWISSDPARTPIIGCYDEGNPEVADWEIKYMVDHAIDCFFPCWYRIFSGSGPFKQSRQNSGLNAYQRARYSDFLHYALLIESNSQMKSMDDWKYNVVPFIIEHYFKDPRYLVIDNKPVLACYEGLQGTGDYGEALNYLKSKCMEIGFAGLTAINNAPHGSSDGPVDGFDYTYTYCQLYNPESTPLHISSPSVNWDDRPWNSGLGPYFVGMDARSKTDYKNLLTEQKACMPGKTGLAQTLLMLDNWNEYGEGHFLVPTMELGYRYLDAIREVFGDGSAHTDLMPTPEQKMRLNFLYPGPPVIPIDTIPMDSSDVALVNRGFESPVISSYQYLPSGAGWTFTSGAGIERNGSAFGAADAPEGAQAAFLQRRGSVSQTAVFEEGSYYISFKTANRDFGNQTFDVSFDNNKIGTFTPSSSVKFIRCSTSVFTATAGEHTITFAGTTEDDKTAFIDAICIKKYGGTAVSGVSPIIQYMELASIPNPANPVVSIHYALPSNTGAVYRIFNMQGQLVYSAILQAGSQGKHGVLVWQGQDLHGKAMPSGVYTGRLSSSSEKVLVNRMVLLK